jgi:hypothetical protein
LRAAAVASKEVLVTYPGGGYEEDGVRQDPLDAPDSGGRTSPAIDAVRLWTGGVATAVVAALVAIVGVLIASALFHTDVIGPTGKGSWGDLSTAWLAALAAVAALLATGMFHLLLLSTPQPRRFFTWIVGLTTAAFALVPLLVDATRAEQLATTGVVTAVGVLIGSLLSGVAMRAARASR